MLGATILGSTGEQGSASTFHSNNEKSSAAIFSSKERAAACTDGDQHVCRGEPALCTKFCRSHKRKGSPGRMDFDPFLARGQRD
jgi:hypothetical protein